MTTFMYMHALSFRIKQGLFKVGCKVPSALSKLSALCKISAWPLQVGKTLFQQLPKLSANSAAVVVALQEIEMGSGSVAMAAAKDVLMKRQQVSALHHNPNMRDISPGRDLGSLRCHIQSFWHSDRTFDKSNNIHGAVVSTLIYDHYTLIKLVILNT